MMKHRIAHRIIGVAAVAGMMLLMGCDRGGVHNQPTGDNQDPDVGTLEDAGTQDVGEIVPELPEISESAAELASTRCDVIFDCCDADDREAIFGEIGDSAADCSASTGVQFPGLGATGALAAAVANGNAIFHEHRVELCSQAIQGISCSEFQSDDDFVLSLPGCGEIVEGVLEDGEDCETDFECQSGQCYYESMSEFGVCHSLPRVEGEECFDGQCGGLTYCHPNTDLCVQKKTLGAECFWNEECNTGYCGDTDEDEQSCQEPPAACGG